MHERGQQPIFQDYLYIKCEHIIKAIDRAGLYMYLDIDTYEYKSDFTIFTSFFKVMLAVLFNRDGALKKISNEGVLNQICGNTILHQALPNHYRKQTFWNFWKLDLYGLGLAREKSVISWHLFIHVSSIVWLAAPNIAGSL